MDLDLGEDAMALATAITDPFNRRDFDAMIAMGGGGVDYPHVALGQHITDPVDFRAAMQGWVDGFSDLRGTVTSAAVTGTCSPTKCASTAPTMGRCRARLAPFRHPADASPRALPSSPVSTAAGSSRYGP